MRNKHNFWRHTERPPEGTTVFVRHAVCTICGATVGGDIASTDGEILARELRMAARSHHKRTGHKEFFFTEGHRRDRHEKETVARVAVL